MCIIYVYVVFMNLFPIPLIYRLDMSVSQKSSVSMKDPFAHTI